MSEPVSVPHRPVTAPCANIHTDLLSYSPDRLLRDANEYGWPLADMFEVIDRCYRASPRLRAKASRAHDLDSMAPRPRGMARIEQDAACGQKYPNALRTTLLGGDKAAKAIWAAIWHEMDVDGHLTAAAPGMTIPARTWVQAVRTVCEYREGDRTFSKPFYTSKGSQTTVDQTWATQVIARLDEAITRRARKHNWPLPYMLSAVKQAYEQTPGTLASARARVNLENQHPGPQESGFRRDMTLAWRELWWQLRPADPLRKNRIPNAAGGTLGLGRARDRDWTQLARAVGQHETESTISRT